MKLATLAGRMGCGLIISMFAATSGAQSVPGIHVAFHENAGARAAGVLVGSGIEFVPGASTHAAKASDGHDIVWVEAVRKVDTRGGLHVAYRQVVRAQAGDVEVFGSEVIVHSRGGLVTAVSGRQYDSVAVAETPRISKLAAVDAASAALRPNLNGRALSDADRLRVSSETRLKLVKTGQDFRYAYFTYATDQDGVYWSVVVDASTEQVLWRREVNPRSNCSPTSASPTSAVGYPIRPDLRDTYNVRRSLVANSATRPTPFSYEAYWSNVVPMTIFQETTTSAYMCDPLAIASYTVLPVGDDSGVPVYRDRTGQPEWQGAAAGDALYNTNETMSAFSQLGRSGWDGLGGAANVVINSGYYSGSDFAFFLLNPGGVPSLPNAPLVGIAPAVNFYNLASSLDNIAHEWGHGVISTSFGAYTDTSHGAQLDEGFADVIGQTVEKLRQPTGYGVEESSDWSLHEDSGAGGYARSGEVDDGTSGHTWTSPYSGSVTFNDTLHKDDESNIQQAHARGNMLNVVFRLLSEGGYNPVCTRLTSLTTSCGTSVTAQGFTKASRILFEAIEFYIPSNARWEDLATYAGEAAHDLYQRCSQQPRYAAFAEQQAVSNAFNAIGYPRQGLAVACP